MNHFKSMVFIYYVIAYITTSILRTIIYQNNFYIFICLFSK